MLKAIRISAVLLVLALVLPLIFSPITTNKVEANGGCSSLTIYVDAVHGNDNYDGLTWATAKQNIQKGVDAACSNGTVYVAAGTYDNHVNNPYEIVHLGENLTLIGAGALTTFIDGGNTYRGISITSDVGQVNTIRGFTIRNGYPTIHGGTMLPTFTSYAAGIGISFPSVRPSLTYSPPTQSDAIGGGIFIAGGHTVTIEDCTIINNHGSSGGGIYNEGLLTMNRCAITGNVAERAGGGLFNLASGYSADYINNQSTFNESNVPGDNQTYKNLGAFIAKSQRSARTGFNQSFISIPVTLNNCAITNNEAANWGGGMASAFSIYELNGCTFSGNTAGFLGGGIGTFWSFGVLVNSTISGNRLTIDSILTSSRPVAGNSLSAGTDLPTISNAGGGMGMIIGVTFFDCDTIANNATGLDDGSYGGGLFNSRHTFNIFVNTIVANNTAAQINTNNCLNRGLIISAGHNIDSQNSCGFTDPTDQINTNPLLGPLQNNGGPTFTCAIANSSPAYGRGDRSFAPDSDQRGVPRPADSCCIGAYEAVPSTVTAVSPASGTQGQCPLTVVITGTNLSGAAAVSFGIGITVSSFTVNSSTQITATVCITGDATPGTYDISVTTPGGTFTGTALFTVGQQNIGPGTHNSTVTGPISLTPPVTNPVIITQSASLSARSVTPGTPVTVTADIINKSAVNGSKKVTLYINGQVDSTQGVTVNSGGLSKLTFNVSRSEPGDYNVYVDGVPAGSFKVELFRESDGILIFSAVLVAMAFILGIIMLWRRQRTV